MDETARQTFVAKKIPKSAKQEQLIKEALKENFVFSSLDDSDIRVLIDSMEVVDITAGDNVITEGQEGDYYYVVESGSFTVTVGGKVVGSIGVGKGFGELALLHNTPRAATVRADKASTVLSLDRSTFRFIIAQSQGARTEEILQSLRRVDIFSDLTDEQLQKIVDAVEIVPYNAGDVIIKKGSEGSIFYMIKDGSIRVSNMGDKYADHTLGAGEYFGERALITGEPRAADVTAVTKCNLMALDREAFNNLLGPLREVLAHNMNMHILTSIKLFEKLSPSEKAKLSKSFQQEDFPAGTVIVKQGDKGRKFYILKEGKADVTIHDEKVGELNSGNFFGEMALLDDEVRKATVTAVKDCECYSIDRPTFTRIMGSLQHIMARETMTRLESLATHGAGGHTTDGGLILMKDLEQLAVLGSGTFGRVTLVKDKKTGNVYALKTMLKSEVVAQKQQLNVINEKNVMMQCNHPFVLRLYQTFKDPKKLYMLLEFVQGGELFSVLHTPQGDGVPDASAKFYAAGVILALAHLHSKEIAYRDMKPENCLVDKEGYPKLVDFGFAKVINGKSFTLCGTPEYLAPELVLGRGHNKAVDYWAYGILLYEMEAGYSPFSDPSGMDQVVICRNIVNGRVVFPRTFNTECKDLVKKLLSREIQNRLGNLKGGTDDIIHHAWFHGFDFEAYCKKQMKAPWLPKVSSPTDTSAFDPQPGDDGHVDNGYVDNGVWDRDF